MNNLQELLYNQGERLVPYISHDNSELIRHRSSYAFFYRVIEQDILNETKEIKIIDLGFGTGYGLALLSSLKNSNLLGVDIAPECEIFAKQYYCRSNVKYHTEDLQTYITSMGDEFDYVVSRGVLEHIDNGLNLIENISLKKRIMIDVPYKEKPGNNHHMLTDITELSFANIQNVEFFYESLDGTIYSSDCFPKDANMIMVVISDPSLPKVSNLFEFPVAPEVTTQLEESSQKNSITTTMFYENQDNFLLEIEKLIKQTEIIVDIGCGIIPMNYFRPKLHIMVEPWKEYADILSYRHQYDKSVLIFRLDALEAMTSFADNSVDSIFLLDVIEHMEKDKGIKVLKECERVAREQVIVFTPLGFMPQHDHGNDAWGLSGSIMQEHKSGWYPSDFSNNWNFYICNNFHTTNNKNILLKNPYGAFFAIKNFAKKNIKHPESFSDIRKPLPSEILLAQITNELAQNKNELAQIANELVQTKDELAQTKDELVQTKDELAQIANELVQTKNELAQTKNELVQTKNELAQTKNELNKYKNNKIIQIVKFIFHNIPNSINQKIQIAFNWKK